MLHKYALNHNKIQYFALIIYFIQYDVCKSYVYGVLNVGI